MSQAWQIALWWMALMFSVGVVAFIFWPKRDLIKDELAGRNAHTKLFKNIHKNKNLTVTEPDGKVTVLHPGCSDYFPIGSKGHYETVKKRKRLTSPARRKKRG